MRRWVVFSLGATGSCWPCLGSFLVCAGIETTEGGEISGVVRMPDICSPTVSPAVVYLTPVSHARGRQWRSGVARRLGRRRVNPGVADLVLVNQRGLQFVPRVQAIALGQTVRFTNEDGETHNVHVVSPGLRVQSVDVAGAIPGFHAGPAGRDEAGVRHSPAHAGVRGRQPDARGSRSAIETGGSGSTVFPTAATS